jgi:hypothetical protein
MQDVQNLRKAVYEYVTVANRGCFSLNVLTYNSYKLKVDACEKGSVKELKLKNIAVNYLFVALLPPSDLCMTLLTRYRYGTLIVFANYLIEIREEGVKVTFPEWLQTHREITKLLERRSLD